MYTRKRHARAWAAIPTIVLIVAIGVIAGLSANAAYTTQVPFDVPHEPTVTLNVGVTAAHIPVAVVTTPTLPSTSTSHQYEQLEPANFAVGFVVGLLLVLISALLVALLRPATAR